MPAITRYNVHNTNTEDLKMADSRPDILLVANVPLDLYAALNAQAGQPAVAVGDKLQVQNKGGAVIYSWASATAPTDLSGGLAIEPLEIAFNNSGDAGAFITSTVVDGRINVSVV